MNSFSSELGVHFGTSLEAPHVIDVESQVYLVFSLVGCILSILCPTTPLQLWAAVIPTGPGNYPLNASYKTAGAYAFQVL